ncbi:MAG: TolC family protein [Deltaproteobacteria bacterium]|nr:TolC family protein [Deltaproteobacteria bacterium]
MLTRFLLAYRRYSLMFFLFLLASSLFLCSGPGWALAAEETGHVFTLKESVAIVLERSLKLLSASQSVEGAKWKKDEASTRFLPKFNATYTYTLLDETPTTSSLSFEDVILFPGTPYSTTLTLPTGMSTRQVGSRDNWQLKLTLTQPIFTGFALTTAYELSKLGVNIAEISLAQTRLDIILQVKQAYFNILQAQKVAKVAIQAVKQREAHLNVARNYYEVGMIAKNQVLQAEVLVAEAVQSRIKAENAILLAKASFNTLLRRPLEAPLEVEDILTYKPFPHDLKYCFERAIDRRPEIEAVQESIKINEQNVRLSKAGHYPTVTVLANHYWKGDTWKVQGSPYMDDYTSWDVTAVLSWNFWTWGQVSDQVKYKRTELTKAHNTLIQVKDGIALEVKSSFLSLKEAEKNIAVARKAIEQAEENYRMSQERYREQVATSAEVTDAETLLTAARRNYYSALYDYNFAWAKLERAMGLGRDKI